MHRLFMVVTLYTVYTQNSFTTSCFKHCESTKYFRNHVFHICIRNASNSTSTTNVANKIDSPPQTKIHQKTNGLAVGHGPSPEALAVPGPDSLIAEILLGGNSSH